MADTEDDIDKAVARINQKTQMNRKEFVGLLFGGTVVAAAGALAVRETTAGRHRIENTDAENEFLSAFFKLYNSYSTIRLDEFRDQLENLAVSYHLHGLPKGVSQISLDAGGMIVSGREIGWRLLKKSELKEQVNDAYTDNFFTPGDLNAEAHDWTRLRTDLGRVQEGVSNLSAEIHTEPIADTLGTLKGGEVYQKYQVYRSEWINVKRRAQGFLIKNGGTQMIVERTEQRAIRPDTSVFEVNRYTLQTRNGSTSGEVFIIDVDDEGNIVNREGDSGYDIPDLHSEYVKLFSNSLPQSRV